MIRFLAALAALTAVPTAMRAQPARKAAQATDLPCKLTDYRIARSTANGLPDTVAVLCDGTPVAGFAASAELYRLQDESVVYPAIETVSVEGPAARSGYWLIFKLTSGLKPGHDYELRLSGTYSRPSDKTVAERFSTVRYRFSTRPDLTPVKTPGRVALDLSSHFQMEASRGAKLIDHSNNREYALEAASSDPDDYDAMGQILIRGGPSQLGPKVEVRGVTDVFGQAQPVKPAKAAPPPAAPKSEDEADWYFNFLHQAGVGITPSWVADIKMAPTLRLLPGGFFLSPSFAVDVGQGQVGQTKTNDLINPKLGASRLVRLKNPVLEAMLFTPSFSYETDRAFDKRNALFDGDWRFYLAGLRNTKAERTQRAFLKARLQNPKVLPQDVPKARFGYDTQIHLGAELGGALTDDTIKSSDKRSQVVVPAYPIRRLRPHVSSTWEAWNFTLSLSIYPRYLFTTENVTRERSNLQPGGETTKTIYLVGVSGWRPYGECSISYAFDPAGHYAINVAYKLGSQPPNFARVNLVQSGILVRF